MNSRSVFVTQDVHDLYIDFVGLRLEFECALEIALVAHANKRNFFHGLIRDISLAPFPSLVIEACDQLVEVDSGSNAVHGHDLDHPAVFLSVEDGAHLQLLHLQCFEEKFFRLYWIAKNVVVIDVVDFKTSVMRGLRISGPSRFLSRVFQ